ncbi:hypothetical protein X738_32575 [Mesorhizobium sp. LNHC209A00]|nr:hypothetical protein X738_32575 [Mesorhizobium sp. LNHC209A00]
MRIEGITCRRLPMVWIIAIPPTMAQGLAKGLKPEHR